MSTQVDNRIVEMQFDNRHFEKNVSTTMSTLDKLKQKLHLKGATTGLENVNNAAKNVNMSGLGSAVQTVSAKFSALEVMGVTALANLTNSAVNAGKRIVSALTIDPVKTGFQEYETQINAVQTILANTSHAGTTIDDVNAALKELNEYADMTIYNFTEMTRNIGTFTAAGLGLEESTKAIQGIANLAAVSGSTSQQASTAMYQLSQALANGKVNLQDWNSVVNAGMGGKVFQDSLVRTAAAMNNLSEEAFRAKFIGDKSFRESIGSKDGAAWLTADVLSQTLQQFTMAAEEGTEQWEAYKKSLKEQGYTDEQVKSILEMANTATDAATKVKTFTQLFDVLKEAAQSGWAQSWKIIVGDFEEAKALLTPLSDFFTGIINGMSDFRNAILESALSKGFTELKDRISAIINPAKNAIGPISDAISGIAGITKSIADHEAVVSSVIRGEWGNYHKRWNKLTEAGYDWVHVQNLVNERLGNSKRRTSEYTEWLKNQGKATDKVTEAESERIAALLRMSDAELEALGYSKMQIASIRHLGLAIEEMADKLGMSVEEFLANIDKINGRWLLIESFKNIGNMLVGMFNTIKDAWQDIFPPKSIEERAEGIFNIIAAFHKFTRSLMKFRDEEGNLTEDGDKLVRTFKGIFAIVDLISSIFGGAFKIAFKVATALLGYFNLNILDVTAYIGDAIVYFRDFLKSLFDIGAVLDFIIPPIQKAVEAFREWFNELKESGKLDAVAEKIKNFFKNIGSSIVSLFDNIPIDFTSGFEIGIWDGIKTAANAIWEFGKAMLAKLREAIDSHSPSKATFSIAFDFVMGFVNGILQFAGKAVDAVIALGIKCVDALKNVDLGNLFALGISTASIVGIFKVGQALSAVVGPLESLDDVFEQTARGIKRTSKGLKSALKGIGTAAKGEAVKSVAIAIGILAASVVVLTLVKPERLWSAVGAIAALGAIVVALTFAMSKFVVGDIGGIGKLVVSVLGIAAAMLLLAAALKVINGLDVTTILGVMSSIIMLFVAIGLIAKSPGAKKVGSFGFIMAKLGVALLLMAVTLKLIGSMPSEQFQMGLLGVIGLLGLIILFISLLQLVGKGNTLNGVDKTLYSVAGVMLIMTLVMKIIGSMDTNQAIQGFLGVAALAAVIVLMVKFLKPLGKEQFLDRVGATLFGVAAAMIVMALVMKIIGGMDPAKALQGMAGVTVLAGLIVAMVYALKPLEKDQSLKRVGRTLLMMSVAIGILALVSVLLGFVKKENLEQGLAAVSVLSLLMMGLVASTRGATNMTGTVIAIAVSITLLVAAVAALGLIDPTKLAIGVLAVSAILGMLALVLAMAGKVQKVTGTMWALVAMITILSAALYLLAQLPIENTLGAAGALSLLLLALSGALVILSMVGTTFSMALQGIILLTAMVVPLAAFIGVLALMSNVKNAEANAKLLIGLMTTMTLLLIPLTLIGAVGILAAAGLATLTGVIVAIGVLVTAIGWLMNEVPELEEFLDKGLGVLEKIALGLGKVLGAFITGFVMTAALSLPILGAALSDFIDKATPFFNGIKMVDADVLKGVGYLTAAMILLAAAQFATSIGALGGLSLAAIGLQLSAFMICARPFFDGIKGVDATSLEGVKALAEAILVLTAANVIDSLTSWFTGGNSLSEFGKELAEFGPYMKQYSDAVSGINVEAVKVSAEAAKSLAEMAKDLPNSGGLLGKIVGNNDMDDFGTQLKSFGDSLMEYGKAVNGIGAYTDSISASVTAAQGLTDLADSIPNSGGFLADFIGDNTMDGFGSQLKSFGISLLDYGKSVEGIGSYTEGISASVTAAEGLTDLAKAMPNSGGFVSLFTGDNNMDWFGRQISAFGKGIKSYGESVDGINTGTITASIVAAKSMVDVAKSVKSLDKGDVGKSELVKFGENLAKFGERMSWYDENISGVNSAHLAATTNEFVALANLAAKLASTDSGGLGNFGIALAKLGADGVNDFINAFNGSVIKVRTAVNNFIATAASTITLGRPNIVTAVNTLINAASAALDVGYDAFYEAGYNFVRGFANGITANSFRASIAARTMAARAITAAKIELDEHSPSRVGYGIGDFFGIAFVNGIADNVKKAYRSSTELAKSAKSGLSDAIGRISDAIDSDIDSQPTIRPVLDLSNVKAGAGTISSLFGDSPVGVMANVGSISAGMSRYNQNGSNDDIVSAIGDLKKALGNGGDTYQINGITYDDGSNIADAVQSLVRAAKVGRRV